jgi:hypothetical protein
MALIMATAAPQAWWSWVAAMVKITRALLSNLEPSRRF